MTYQDCDLHVGARQREVSRGANLCAGAQRGSFSAQGIRMATPINLGPIHHLRLTVTDIQRSRDFYTRLLGFDVAAESPPEGDPSAEAAYPILWGGIVMIRGNV